MQIKTLFLISSKVKNRYMIFVKVDGTYRRNKNYISSQSKFPLTDLLD